MLLGAVRVPSAYIGPVLDITTAARASEEARPSTSSSIIAPPNLTSMVTFISHANSYIPLSASLTAFETLGNKGWNWELLKKYYLKSERFVEPKVKADTMAYDLKEHGKDGKRCQNLK